MSGPPLIIPADHPEEGIVRSPAIFGVAIRELSLCPKCREIHGPWFSSDHLADIPPKLVQECPCDTSQRREQGKQPRPRWPGFDFDCVIELCRCCGLSALESGGRLSVWFCEPCHKAVRAFNDGVGRYAVPVGGHSMMGGRSGLIRPPVAQGEIARFAKGIKDIGETMDRLRAWRQRAVEENVADLGLLASDEIPLAEYLAASARGGVSRELRFTQMLHFLSGKTGGPQAKRASE